ncbi:NAD(P)-binding protein [Xylariomycetidae sp. FL2044]|nr:NAD(P)-binding protein [Xylariomycetidae sp. FL2044]
MALDLLGQTYMKLFPIPLPDAQPFAGQVAVITGGTSGLGLATAAHFVNLGASEVVITSRSAARTKEALHRLEEETGGRSRDVVRVTDLDMHSYDSIVSFADEVKKIRAGDGGVDCVVLNAGAIGVDFTKASSGWEQNIQTNVLSTILPALLLLPWMRSERASRASSNRPPARIAIIGSSQHLAADIHTAPWVGAATTTTTTPSTNGVLAHFNQPENWPGPEAMYSITKLLAQYGANELARMAMGDDGRPDVIINTICPGLVRTELVRSYVEKGPSVGLRVLIAIFGLLFQKTAEQGARTIIRAVMAPEEDHGKFIRFYGSSKYLRTRWDNLFVSETGRAVQTRVWGEVMSELTAKVPGVREAQAGDVRGFL